MGNNSFQNLICIVHQGINHDKPFFPNISSVNMLMFMTNCYTFLQTKHDWIQDCVGFILNL